MTTQTKSQRLAELRKLIDQQLAYHQHHSFFERDWQVADNLKATLDYMAAQDAALTAAREALEDAKAFMHNPFERTSDQCWQYFKAKAATDKIKEVQ